MLILPYRNPVVTAKVLATLDVLLHGRVTLGVGVGWMEPEFRALGVPRRKRGALSDATLDLLKRCFAADEVEENGQTFLFRPRPPRPPIYVGGWPPHAFERAVRYGDGWMPMSGDPERLRIKTSKGEEHFLSDPIEEMRAQFGWSVPVHSMRYWMLGVSDPGLPADETVDDQGRLAELVQLDWEVRYIAYRLYDGTLLPRKLVMESAEVRIRLAVDEWELLSEDADGPGI